MLTSVVDRSVQRGIDLVSKPAPVSGVPESQRAALVNEISRSVLQKGKTTFKWTPEEETYMENLIFRKVSEQLDVMAKQRMAEIEAHKFRTSGVWLATGLCAGLVIGFLISGTRNKN